MLRYKPRDIWDAHEGVSFSGQMEVDPDGDWVSLTECQEEIAEITASGATSALSLVVAEIEAQLARQYVRVLDLEAERDAATVRAKKAELERDTAIGEREAAFSRVARAEAQRDDAKRVLSGVGG